MTLSKNLSMGSSKEEPHRGERVELRSPSHDVAPALNGGAPSKQEITSSQETKKPQTHIASDTHREGQPFRENVVVPLHAGGDHFDELWGIWRRGHLADAATKPEAQRAFIQACNHPDPEVRADPAEIVARARSWIERFPDEPRYLPKLIVWLEERGWETEPPSRHRDNRYRRNGGKADLALLTLQHVG